MFPFSQSVGTSLACHDFSNVINSGFALLCTNSLRTCGCISSGLMDLCTFSFLRLQRCSKLFLRQVRSCKAELVFMTHIKIMDNFLTTFNSWTVTFHWNGWTQFSTFSKFLLAEYDFLSQRFAYPPSLSLPPFPPTLPLSLSFFSFHLLWVGIQNKF